MGYIGDVLGLCRDNGKENGNYYLGFRARVQGVLCVGLGGMLSYG